MHHGQCLHLKQQNKEEPHFKPIVIYNLPVKINNYGIKRAQSKPASVCPLDTQLTFPNCIIKNLLKTDGNVFYGLFVTEVTIQQGEELPLYF